MSKKFDKELKLLQRKNEHRCSICKMRFLDDELTFTSIGYDKRRKLQLTTSCCEQDIVDLRQIGIFGTFDPEEFGVLIQEHPQYAAIYGEKPMIVEPYEPNEYDDEIDLPPVTLEDREIVAKIVEKYFNAQALMVNEGDITEDIFKEVEQKFMEKYDDPDIASQKCLQIMAEIASFG